MKSERVKRSQAEYAHGRGWKLRTTLLTRDEQRAQLAAMSNRPLSIARLNRQGAEDVTFSDSTTRNRDDPLEDRDFIASLTALDVNGEVLHFFKTSLASTLEIVLIVFFFFLFLVFCPFEFRWKSSVAAGIN